MSSLNVAVTVVAVGAAALERLGGVVSPPPPLPPLGKSSVIGDEIAMDAGLRYPDATGARATAKALSAQLATFKRDPIAAMLLNGVSIGVRDADVVFSLEMNRGMASMTLEALMRMAK